MNCQPKKWLPWIGIPVFFWVAANFFGAPSIEAELSDRASGSLKSSALDWASAKIVNGRDVVLSGIADSEGGLSEARAAADRASGVRLVNASGMALPPTVPAYVWQASRSANTLTLSGSVPTYALKAQITEAAKKAFPGVTVVDQQALARTAPEGFAALTSAGLVQLAKLSAGSVGVTDRAYSISGDAPSIAAFESIQADIKALPQGFSLAKADVNPPKVTPFTWSAELKGKAVTLEGYVPSQAVKSQLAVAAAKVSAGVSVRDNTKLALGAPAGFAAMAAVGLAQLTQLENGKASLSDTAYSIVGSAPSVAAFEAISAEARQLPAGFSLLGNNVSPATVSPFTWSAELKDKVVTLEGYVPSEAVKSQLAVDAAKISAGVSVRDNTKLALGAPAGFVAIAGVGLTQLSKMTAGKSVISDQAYAISGNAIDAVSFDSAWAGTQQLPPGFKLASAAIVPPIVQPYTWQAAKSGNAVTVSGYVPSPEIRSLVLDQARKANAGASVVDAMKLASGAPSAFSAITGAGLVQLSRMTAGTVSLRDTAYTIVGETADFQNFDGVMADSKVLPTGFTLAQSNVLPPTIAPFLWSVERKGNIVTLDGVIPSEAVKQQVAARAAQLSAGGTVVDRTRVARGGPPGDWSAAAIFGMDQLGKIAEGKAMLSDSKLSISGIGKLDYSGAQVASAATALPAGFPLVQNTVTLPAVHPYVLTVTKSPLDVTLSGYAPSESAKAKLETLARAASISGQVVNRLQVAAGVPAGVNYSDAGDFMIAQLVRLKAGEARLVDADFTIKGEAPDQVVYDAVTASLKGKIPGGVKLQSEQINIATVSPYLWNASRSPGQLTMGGYFPDEKAHTEIIDITRRRFAGDKVVDKMQLGNGAARNHVAAVTVALEQLSRFETGTISINDTSITVQGEALFEIAAEQIRARIASALPQGWSGTSAVSVQPPLPAVPNPACQALFVDLISAGRIYFETGKAVISGDSVGVLDRAISIASRCPEATIEVAGHTDADGNAASNQDLSERRANAVADYMIKTGALNAARLSAVGYGPTRPIAPNDTEEGKARNRRIEFVVK